MQTESNYYYAEPGGTIQGPLALSSIRAAQAAGRLTARALVSINTDGPWEEIQQPASKAVRVKASGSVAGFYEALGFVMAALGALNIGFGVSFALAGSVKWVSCAVGMVSCFVLALGLLATAEVLNRLREIAASVRRPEN